MTRPGPGEGSDRRGTYVLFLRPRGRGEVRVGRLGTLRLSPGRYAYVGSAFGPGGLEARLGRHVRGGERLHWHVDYLRRRCDPVGAWVTRDEEPREHRWARALSAAPGSRSPLPGFGASDCSCGTHLHHFEALPSLEAFRERAAAVGTGPAAAPVRRWEV